jgi:hypothetical protein
MILKVSSSEITGKKPRVRSSGRLARGEVSARRSETLPGTVLAFLCDLSGSMVRAQQTCG